MKDEDIRALAKEFPDATINMLAKTAGVPWARVKWVIGPEETKQRIAQERDRVDRLRAEAIKLRRSGSSFAKIGEALDISRQRAYQLVREANGAEVYAKWAVGNPRRAG